MMLFQEPVNMRVIHPEKGAFDTKAFCALDAKLQAAAYWDIPLDETRGCKVFAETAALQRARKEAVCNEDS